MSWIATTAAALAALVGGVALGTGYRATTDAQNAAGTGAAPEPSLSQTTGDDASGDLTGDDPSGDPTGDEPDEAPPPPAPKASGGGAGKVATGRLDEDAFWGLIAATRSAAGNDTSRQSELLKDRLSKLAPQAIIDFARIRQRLDRRAYTWNLWGAAYVIEDGCSDDCFRDFRGYVISLGRGPYERAMSNPDSLASVAQDAETGSWENADNVAPDAYSSATGGDYPLDDSDLSGRPRGKPFNENNMAALIRRYPRLAARFR